MQYPVVVNAHTCPDARAAIASYFVGRAGAGAGAGSINNQVHVQSVSAHMYRVQRREVVIN